MNNLMDLFDELTLSKRYNPVVDTVGWIAWPVQAYKVDTYVRGPSFWGSGPTVEAALLDLAQKMGLAYTNPVPLDPPVEQVVGGFDGNTTD